VVGMPLDRSVLVHVRPREPLCSSK